MVDGQDVTRSGSDDRDRGMRSLALHLTKRRAATSARYESHEHTPVRWHTAVATGPAERAVPVAGNNDIIPHRPGTPPHDAPLRQSSTPCCFHQPHLSPPS